jgi:two-component system response regulator ResD
MATEGRSLPRDGAQEPAETPAASADAQLAGRRVLIIEDEEGITQLVRLYLEEAGAEVLAATDGITGLELHVRERPDLIILDVMLPGLDGWEVCRRIREIASTPIVMLTARALEGHRIRGLDLGADDYVTKPFSPRELVSRIRAILRRVAAEHQGSPQHPDRLTYSGLTIVPAARRVEVNGAAVELTAREFDLLVTLVCAPEHVFSREALFRQVWGYEYLGDSRAVDVCVATLRKKIERDAGDLHYIRTVRGAGYAFSPGARPLDSEKG